ncbi:MAG TPA: RsmE family RNA methyltransferase [Gemmatimonadales bacterium]|nr:RsmE family RNA methyltransferase [Gemmatimonadales bacterium]
MIAVLVEPGIIKVGALLSLDLSEVHHLEVRRAASGDQVRLMDGRGTLGLGTVSLGKKEARVEVLESRRVEPAARLILGVGAGDRERFGWLVEKCAELGVSEIVPLVTQRSANVAGRVRAEHIEKLGRRGLEAIKQSGNPHAPVVREPVDLTQFARGAATEVKLVAEQGGGPVGTLAPDAPVTCAIGPEGGWTPEEVAVLTAAKFRGVGLGEFTLRFETAAVAAVVAVRLARGGI